MNNDKNKFFEQEFSSLKISPQTLFCVLSYVYILWIVSLLSDKNNNIVKFHANQGIILSTISLFSLIIINILSSILYSIAPVLSSFSAFLEVLWLLFYFVFTLIGIKNAVKQIQQPLPLIGNLFTFIK